MRQRVMIAMALACKPDVLIADEPTTALDVTVQAQIIDLLQSLQRELGMGLIMVSHDLELVGRLCSRVLVMYAGQVVEDVPVANLFAEPGHPYSRALLSAALSPENKGRLLPTIPGFPPEPGRSGSGCRFAPRCRYAVESCVAAPPPMVLHATGDLVRCIRHHELDALDATALDTDGTVMA
jgi:oligopeptide/dipeptide ABC transporter ATP-binding protein